MKKGRIIPNDSVYDVVTFDILSDGIMIDPAIQVISFNTNKEINGIPTAKIVIMDGDPATEEFDISDSDIFNPGKKIEIKGGRDGRNTTLFKGVISCHEIKIGIDGTSVLSIECQDEAIKLTTGQHTAFFTEKKDSDIIKEILGNNGLTSQIEDTSLVHELLVQYDATDWDFIVARAKMNGQLVIPDDGTITVTAPNVSAKEVLTLTYGMDLLEFVAATDTPTQRKKIGANSAAPKIRGRAKFVGVGSIKPCDLIEMKGVGKRFSGKVFVTGVFHNFEDGEWLTQIQFGLNEEWLNPQQNITESPSTAVLQGTKGLQTGKVVQLGNDPKNENRALVNLPSIDKSTNGIWSRVATLDAGKNTGTFFMPEVGDEVIVGFLNNDPREPIVLGMLHSSKNPAPADTNPEKGIWTKSGMKILFDDKDQVLTIETLAGNKIALNENSKSVLITDQNKNSIKMETSGITLDSQKDINIVAKGNINIKAAQDLNLTGLKITEKAQTQLDMQGAASAKLSSSAIVEVKGSLVKIN